MQQMSVCAEAIHAAVGRVGEAGTRAACALTQQRIGHGPVGVVNDGDRKIVGGRQNVSGQSNDSPRTRSRLRRLHLPPVGRLSPPKPLRSKSRSMAEGIGHEGVGTGGGKAPGSGFPGRCSS